MNNSIPYSPNNPFNYKLNEANQEEIDCKSI